MHDSSVQRLIDLWPSLATFAEDAGINTNSAKQMRRRSSIPSDYWVKIVAGAARRDIEVTYEALALAHAKPSMDEVAASEAAT